MSNSYAEFLMPHQRLAILRHLQEAAHGKANDSLLAGIMSDLGLALSRDQLRSMLAWLAEQDLVVLSNPLAGVTVAQITERGLDIARGAARVPGVLVPSPAARTLRTSGEG